MVGVGGDTRLRGTVFFAFFAFLQIFFCMLCVTNG